LLCGMLLTLALVAFASTQASLAKKINSEEEKN
jgi:hypothetical protein